METQFLIILNFCLGCVINHEVWLEVRQLFFTWLNEHVRYEMCLPGNLHDETDSHTRILVRTAECINHIEFLIGKLFFSNLFNRTPRLLSCLVVIIMIGFRIPPYRIAGRIVLNDEFIFRRTACEDTGLDVYCAKL